MLLLVSVPILLVSAIKRDLKAWDMPRDLCLNMSAWKTAIDVPEP